MGSYQYLPGGGELNTYVLMLGYNDKKNIIEAIGVGKISDKVLTTVKPVNYPTLDYIGYSVVLPAQQELVEKYINNELSFTELTSSIMLGNL